MATPVEYCERTDRRGVYAQARNGTLIGLAGVDEDFEVPKDANLTVDLTQHSIPQVVHSAFSLLFLARTSRSLSLGVVLLLETSGLL